MLIWINGPFGVGKTKAARRLVKMNPDFRLFDPERIGFLLRDIWPASEIPDFQDLPIWREMVLRTLAAACAGTDRMLVVPMTLADPAYFREIVGGLRDLGIDVRHFTLMAPAVIVRRRNRLRLIRPRSKRWALARVEPCLARLADAQFAVHIDTARKKVGAVAHEILARAGLPV
jgi:hypothetical protein